MATVISTSTNNIIKSLDGNAWLQPVSLPAIPAYTMRFLFRYPNITPQDFLDEGQSYPASSSWTQLSASPNIWDFTYQDTSWERAFYEIFDSYGVDILGANITNVTDISSAFYACSNILTIAYFDTINITEASSAFDTCRGITKFPNFNFKNVENINSMFFNCESLEELPMCDFTSATYVTGLFHNCRSVENNILNMYNYLSSKPIATAFHEDCFTGCGSSTTAGAAELLQIPAEWK